MNKIKEWINRYFWIEIAATCTAVVFGSVAQIFLDNLVILAYIATWSDNLIYYGLMSFRELQSRKKKDKKISVIGLLKVLRNMIVEFSPAEYLDSFFIRPLFMAVMLISINKSYLAFLLGSVFANITFYIPVIISYELRKKLFRD